jgi:hypothetical protein
MALIQYGNHYTDDRFTPLVEPNLFGGAPFQPGVSFTDKYQTGPGGQILIHKLGISTVTPGTPGSDFTDADVADSTIALPLDTAFQRSRKIYNALASAVAYPAAAQEMEIALQEVNEGWHLEAMKNLLAGETSVTAPTNTTATATDGSDIYDDIIANRQKLVEAKAKPSTIIVSPDTLSKLLKSPEFQRTGSIGDSTVAEGIVGRIAGLDVIEYNIFDSAYEATDVVAGTTLDANDAIEYVMYDKDAFSIVSGINMIRLKDSERFNGSLAQIEIVSGFKVTNDDRVLAKVVVNA